MADTLNQFFAISLLVLGFGAFIVKAGLNIRDARRKPKQEDLLNWRHETIKSFTILWNIIVILGMASILLYFLLKVIFQ